MDCERFGNLLSLYAGEDLEHDEALGVQAHLAICSECRKEVEEYQAARTVLSSLRDPDISEDIREEIWRRVSPAAHGGQVRRWATFALPAAAAVLVGLTIGYIVDRTFHPGNSTSPTNTLVQVDRNRPENDAVDYRGSSKLPVPAGSHPEAAPHNPAESQDPAAMMEHLLRKGLGERQLQGMGKDHRGYHLQPVEAITPGPTEIRF